MNINVEKTPNGDLKFNYDNGFSTTLSGIEVMNIMDGVVYEEHKDKESFIQTKKKMIILMHRDLKRPVDPELITDEYLTKCWQQQKDKSTTTSSGS